MKHNSANRLLLLLLLICSSFAGCSLLSPTEPQLPVWLQKAQTLDGRLIPQQRDSWAGFRNPETPESTGLYLLEPFQSGKVPLVFIHGLASDPLTWQTAIDRLRSDPDVAERYQFWVFRYATGNSYLKAAADLRRELEAARDWYNPCGTDFAFDQVVLVGHSMGGLVAKLQVASSGETIWNTISEQPLDTFRLEDQTRHDVESAVLFEPVPFVRQVVFIATPHRGSALTEGSLGRLARRLIEFPQTMQDEYLDLIRENTALLKGTSPRLPTSLDHLNPDSPILHAIERLPFSPDVYTHSIIGIGHRSPNGSDGDGVVPVSSARIEGVASEWLIKATHRGIHHNPRTIEHLRQILLSP